MYLYLYDNFLNDKKYSRQLAKMEMRLTDLGIGGKIVRLSPLRNVEELLSQDVRNGIKTVVVVGDDKTISQAINFIGQFDVTLGIIPVGSNNKIAKSLGIDSTMSACDVLAARKVERLDLGKANNIYFLANISISGGPVTFECENNYQITASSGDQVNICNLAPIFASVPATDHYFDPQDGLLEVLIQPLGQKPWNWFSKKTATGPSFIPLKRLSIRGKNSLSLVTDGSRVLKTPVEIEIVPKKLRVIVGKKRVF